MVTQSKKAAIGKLIPKARSYNSFKEFEGKRYTGMQIGRSHKWNYDKGVWKETKVTPERWEITYSVTKRRAGHAPEGSGAAVGTAYHWFILSHQFVEKLNADDYTTSMVGLKFKVAHRRAGKDKWSASDNARKKTLVRILKDMIAEIEREPQKAISIPLEFEHKGKGYKGMGVPVMSSCEGGVCKQLDVTLNNKHLGVIKCTKKGWKLTDVPQGLANAIGNEVFLYYE
ncbi:MAG TPA: hypothetical protein VK508_18075 [Cyclobacteriaceae bacterium]|nr:hypothetical protein [Cyclobacteriaceae bacterium]